VLQHGLSFCPGAGLNLLSDRSNVSFFLVGTKFVINFVT
jgi:hypothetical protein